MPKRRRRSHLPLQLVSASVAGVAVAMSLVPGVAMRKAEGCSGGDGSGYYDCDGPGVWRSLEVLSDVPVPTDGGVWLRGEPWVNSCPPYLQPQAAAVAGETRVEGGVKFSHLAKNEAGKQIAYMLWVSATPLSASSTYSLELEGVLVESPGAAGAGGAGGLVPAAPLAFTTGPGPTGSPPPPAGLAITAAAKPAADQACCTSQVWDEVYCDDRTTTWCIDAVVRERPEMTVSFTSNAPESNQAYLVYELYEIGSSEVSLSIPGVLFGPSVTGQRIFRDEARHCFRLETRNLVTGEKLSSDAPCFDPPALGPEVTANCAELSNIVGQCAPRRPGDLYTLTGGELHDAYCQAPPAGAGGAGGGPGGPGGAGGGPGGAGGAGAPATKGPPATLPVVAASGENDGCQVRGGAGARLGAFGLALVAAGLGAWRRKRAARPAGE